MARRQLRKDLRAVWDYDRNGSSLGITTSSTQQYYFKASCGQHSRLLQPASAAAALRRSGSLRCPICQPAAGQTSRHAPAVQQAVTASGQQWVPEVYCLRGHTSPADIWLPQLRLAIQIDGAHHTDVAMYSTPAADQAEIDARFDSSIIRAGLRALRIHYRDSQRPAAVVSWAIQLCQQLPNTAFVAYSSSYRRLIKWAADD